jgi:hypothetical protein
MTVRIAVGRLALSAAAPALLAAALIACPPAQSAVTVHAKEIPEPLPFPEEDLARFGCNRPYVVCVNACTGSVIDPDRVPTIPAGEPFKIRTIGWGSCAPKSFECKAQNVPNLDVSLRDLALDTPPPTDGGDPPPMTSDNAPPSGSDQIEAFQSLHTAAAARIGAGNETGKTAKTAKAWDPLLKETQSAADEATAAANESHGGNDFVGVAPLLGALALQKAVNAEIPLTAVSPAIHVASCADALAATKRAVVDQQRNLEKNQKYAGNAGIRDDIETATSELSTYSADLNAVQCDANDAGSKPDAGAQGPSPDELHAAARAANVALRRVQRQANRAARTASYAARGTRVTSFGDCVMTVPTDGSYRQLVVDVKFTPESACDRDPTSASCVPADPDAATSPPSDASTLEPATKDALVYVNVDHGYYYWDVGLLTALVPFGQRSVVTPQAPGIPGSHVIVVDERASVVTEVAVNASPWGHRRQAYSFMENGGRFLDALGFRLGVGTDTAVTTPTLTLGVLFEPVTGLSVDLGGIVLEGDFLKKNYAEGMVPPADRNDYVTRTPMVRLYFGLTFAYEFLHTTTTQSAAIQNLSPK